jgi:hypothetical protein
MTEPPQQLDIFAHSRDVMLRNAALEAIERRDAPAALAAVAALADEFADDVHLPALQRLARSLEQRSSAPLPDHAALARERAVLEHELSAAARQALGAPAGAVWMHTAWAALAARCEHLPFDPAHADDHDSALWLRAAQWQAAATAVQRIASWRRIPAPLAWMTQARFQLDGIDAAWPLLAELAWMAPARLAALLRTLHDPLLARLQRRFDEAEIDDSGSDALAWFPAWVLTQSPAVAVHLAQAQPGQHTAPERGLRLMVELLGLERQGRHHELMQQRRTLRDLCAPLYADYMATR